SFVLSVGRQHFLYFLPLPQGQGSLRPGLAIQVDTSSRGRTSLCMQRYWLMPPFTTFSSHVIGTLLAKLGSEDAGSAGVRCILAIIGASRVAASVVWGPSMIGASACAARDTGVVRARHRPRCDSSGPRCI